MSCGAISKPGTEPQATEMDRNRSTAWRPASKCVGYVLEHNARSMRNRLSIAGRIGNTIERRELEGGIRAPAVHPSDSNTAAVIGRAASGTASDAARPTATPCVKPKPYRTRRLLRLFAYQRALNRSVLSDVRILDLQFVECYVHVRQLLLERTDIRSLLLHFVEQHRRELVVAHADDFTFGVSNN
jgi:hypothetical protein